MKSKIVLIALVALMVSCKKDEVSKLSPSFEGTYKNVTVNTYGTWLTGSYDIHVIVTGNEVEATYGANDFIATKNSDGFATINTLNGKALNGTIDYCADSCNINYDWVYSPSGRTLIHGRL